MNRKLMNEVNDQLGGAFTNMLVLKDLGFCPTCGGKIEGFRDKLSAKEFGISGMCQKCQDSVFGGEE